MLNRLFAVLRCIHANILLTFVVGSSFTFAVHAQGLPSLRITDRTVLETPSSALVVYGTITTHSNGYGAGRSDELKSTAFGLSYDADTIYTYVRDHVEFYPTFGLGKGALGAHLDKSGNAFDQAALMVDLLQESAANGAVISSIQYRLGTLSLNGAEAESLFDVRSAQTASRHTNPRH